MSAQGIIRLPNARNNRIREAPRIRGADKIMRIRGVDVYFHWTVFLIALLILLNAGRKPWMTLTALLSFLGLLLLHEAGHMIAAQRLGTHVREIRLYPIFGLCFLDPPWSRFDHCVIAWGGVLAQAVVAIPIVLYTSFFGFTRFDALNAVIAIFGGYSLVVAVFNLLPSFAPPPDQPLPLAALGPQCAFRRRAIEHLEAKKIPYRIAANSPSLAGLWAALLGNLGITARTGLNLPEGLVASGSLYGLPTLGQLPVTLHRSTHSDSQAIDRMASLLSESLKLALLSESKEKVRRNLRNGTIDISTVRTGKHKSHSTIG